MLYPDQAGFMLGRNLYNHIKLAQVMLAYAEADFKDGIIMSLDQEKVYDKIDHDSLWDILRMYGFPSQFISKITVYKCRDIGNGGWSNPCHNKNHEGGKTRGPYLMHTI